MALGLGIFPAPLWAQKPAAKDDHAHEQPKPLFKEAVCVLQAMKQSGVSGALVLRQEKDDVVVVSGEVSGLKPGQHGFHIHMFGDLRAADGTSAGGHYNPHGHDHGDLASAKRHSGDLGNITANAQGVAKVDIKVSQLTIHEILGRSLVVHADADDLKSQPAGNAGARIAVGVIGLAEVKPSAEKK